MKGKKYISASEAAKKLHVSPLRISRLVKSGQLAGKVETFTQQHVMVDVTSLAKAILAICVQCGKEFKPKALGLAKCCSKSCKNKRDVAMAALRRQKQTGRISQKSQLYISAISSCAALCG